MNIVITPDLTLLVLAGLLLALIGVYAFYQRNKRNKLAKEKAEADLEFKTKELTTHALHLAKKNEVLKKFNNFSILPLLATNHLLLFFNIFCRIDEN